jgi:hypothetical protein
MQGNRLPPGTEYVERRVNALRRKLETIVVELKGTISVIDAAAIQGALRWERYACLAAHWLRKEASTLSASDRLRFAEAMAKGGDNRDRNIRLLGLDRDEEDTLLTDLYSRKPRLLPGPEQKGEAS